MTAPDFTSANETLDWAFAALKQLGDEFRAFVEDNDNCSFVTEFDQATGDTVDKYRIHADPPTSFRRLATEALNNTKHAFDQATFAIAAPFAQPRDPHAYFPWGERPNDTIGRLNRLHVPEAMHAPFLSVEPWPRGPNHDGGDNVVRALATLANRKHTLNLEIGAAIVGQRYQLDIDRIEGPGRLLIGPGPNASGREIEFMRYRGKLVSNTPPRYEVRVDLLFDEPTIQTDMNAPIALRLFALTARKFIDNATAALL